MYLYSTKCFHFIQRCTKIVSVWGSSPDPAGRAYNAPPYSHAGIEKGSKEHIQEYHTVGPLHQILANDPSFGLYLDHITCFFEKDDSCILRKKCILLKCTKMVGIAGASLQTPLGSIIYTILS